MKHLSAFILTLLLATIGYAQEIYNNSLKRYQQQYIRDLYPIIKDDTAYIRFYPVNTKMIIEADVQLLPDEKPFKMITSSGKSKDAQKYALLTFKLDGKTYHLYTYQLLKLKEKPETANDLFLPFIDKTCGKESYGGGRYIDLLTTKINDGKITIDFNKAYNPYCAFAKGYNCPIPPRENVLPITIKAGERYQKNKFKH